MKEFNCKVSWTWSSDEEREDAFKHRQRGNEENGKKSQLDYIIGAEERCDDIHICNGNKAWTTWDHCFFHARIRQDCLDVLLRRPSKNREEAAARCNRVVDRKSKELVWVEAEDGGGEEGTHDKINDER